MNADNVEWLNTRRKYISLLQKILRNKNLFDNTVTPLHIIILWLVIWGQVYGLRQNVEHFSMSATHDYDTLCLLSKRQFQ